MAVPVDVLVAMFCGEWIHDLGEWDTTPCYKPALAFEVARATRSRTEAELRKWFYGDWSVDDIPSAAKEAIGLGWHRYKTGL